MHKRMLKVALGAALSVACYGAPPDVTQTSQAAVTRVVVPVINASMKTRLRAVYASGLAQGNRAAVFSKVGDGITATGSFLTDIGCSVENLGVHPELASTISYFRATSVPGRATVWCGASNSFSMNSVAAALGWTTAAVLAPITRTGCASPYNTALRCELHLTHPSVALVMLGTNDLERVNDLTVYRTNLTQIVADSIAAGVIPVLSTIPPRLDNAALGARVAAYNDAIIAVATALQVPLWNYRVALAASTMLNQGMGSDGVYPSTYSGQYACSFTDAALRYGYNQRNLTAVQVLAHVRAVVIDDGSPDP